MAETISSAPAASPASPSPSSPPSSSSEHPRAPVVTYPELLKQFRADVYGKEVQSAATYSYMWMADQMGHVCVGILVNYPATLLARLFWYLFGWQRYAEAGGLILTIAIVAYWEARTFFSDEHNAKGLFPLGRELLRDNAAIATVYMSLGAFIGFGFHLGVAWGDLAFIVVCTFVAIWVAPGWLRQKIIWQKAALPYLSRLADMEPTMKPEAAQALQTLINTDAPPAVKPRQVIIGGPVGSGRTQLATGIGTEFAFRKVKARYISMQSLLEFASAVQPTKYPDDLGPANVGYWPWSEAQVVIIDDIGPLIAPQRDQQQAMLEHFQGILNQELKPIADVLGRCHTVWVIGDLCQPGSALLAGEVLNEFAKAVAGYTGGKDPLVIELRTIAAAAPGVAPQATAEARYVSTD